MVTTILNLITEVESDEPVEALQMLVQLYTDKMQPFLIETVKELTECFLRQLNNEKKNRRQSEDIMYKCLSTT